MRSSQRGHLEANSARTLVANLSDRLAAAVEIRFEWESRPSSIYQCRLLLQFAYVRRDTVQAVGRPLAI